MTIFLGGTTPATSSLTLMDQTYGKSLVTRLYNSGSLTAPALTDRRVVGSFKTINGSLAADAAKYWRLFYIHEIDSKIAKGQWTLANWKADMTTLKNQGFNLGVCLTADVFVNPNKNPDDYLIPGITHYGIDFDGLSFSDHYHDYTPEFNACNTWAAAHGLSIGVPEFGANRATSNDPNDTTRAAWCDTWTKKFQAARYEYVCWWEYSGQTGSQMTAPNGVNAVKRLVLDSN